MEVGGGPSAALRRSRSPPPTPGEDDGGDPFLALLSKQHGQQQQQQQRHLDKRRNPLVWPSASSSDFNLTELIDSVERDIWRLEQMERRGRGGGGGLNVHAVLGPSLLLAPLLPIKTEEQDDVGLAEEIKNLPGYKPSSSTSRRREGNLIRMPDIGTGRRHPPSSFQLKKDEAIKPRVSPFFFFTVSPRPFLQKSPSSFLLCLPTFLLRIRTRMRRGASTSIFWDPSPLLRAAGEMNADRPLLPRSLPRRRSGGGAAARDRSKVLFCTGVEIALYLPWHLLTQRSCLPAATSRERTR